MEWLNVFGLVMVAVIMIPNILFAMKCKDGFVNKWNNNLWKPWNKSVGLAALDL